VKTDVCLNRLLRPFIVGVSTREKVRVPLILHFTTEDIQRHMVMDGRDHMKEVQSQVNWSLHQEDDNSTKRSQVDEEKQSTLLKSFENGAAHRRGHECQIDEER
jgi:hypothetical protein